MKKMRMLALAFWTATGLMITGGASADDQRAQYGYGAGPMPYGPGMMGGYPRPGMGPGMMPGYGYGGGEGYGYYGPGMMHGGRGGMGPGMMGGPGMGGPGMMGGIGALDLSKEQREAISDLMASQQRAQFERLARIREAASKLQQLYSQSTWDADAIGQVYGKMFDARREGIVSMIRTRNRILEQLTDEQRQQLRGYGGRSGG